MSNTVALPSRELRRLIARIDFAMGAILSDRGNAALRSDMESVPHAWTLSNLSLRHAEATTTLAARDSVLAPSGWVTARAAVEATAKCVWLLEPEDKWVREARWLALIHEGGRFGARRQVADREWLVKQSASISDFAHKVQAKLPADVSVAGVPSTDEILAASGTGLDGFYVTASQYMHSAELATRSFRRDLGTAAQFSESLDERNWIEPLTNAYKAFRASARVLMRETSAEFGETSSRADSQVGDALTEFIVAAYARVDERPVQPDASGE